MICFKMFAKSLILELLADIFKAMPALFLLGLALWLAAGVFLLPGCSHTTKHLNPAPDFYLAMNVK